MVDLRRDGLIAIRRPHRRADGHHVPASWLTGYWRGRRGRTRRRCHWVSVWVPSVSSAAYAAIVAASSKTSIVVFALQRQIQCVDKRISLAVGLGRT